MYAEGTFLLFSSVVLFKVYEQQTSVADDFFELAHLGENELILSRLMNYWLWGKDQRRLTRAYIYFCLKLFFFYSI